MALRRNSILAGILVAGSCMSWPALADDSAITGRENDHRSDYLDDNYIYDYMSHRDSITIGLGDAPTSNIIIQHPTPWPSYINNTNIDISGDQGISALDNMMQQGASGGTTSSAGSSGASSSAMPSPVAGSN